MLMETVDNTTMENAQCTPVRVKQARQIRQTLLSMVFP